MFSIFQFYVCGCIIGYCLATLEKRKRIIESFKVIHLRNRNLIAVYLSRNAYVFLRVKKREKKGLLVHLFINLSFLFLIF